MNNRTLKNKFATNMHCQICSRKLIFLKTFQNFIYNGTFKNNGKASYVARFVLLLES